MLNQEQKDILKAELEKPEYEQFGHDYPAIAAHLNAIPTIPNPDSQTNIQKPYSLTELLGLLDQDELINFLGVAISFREWSHSRLSNQSFTAKSDLITTIAALLPTATGEKPFLEAVSQIVNLQSKSLLLALNNVLFATGMLGAESKAAIESYANATIADPSYQPNIPGSSIAQALELPALTEFDIQEALN